MSLYVRQVIIQNKVIEKQKTEGRFRNTTVRIVENISRMMMVSTG